MKRQVLFAVGALALAGCAQEGIKPSGPMKMSGLYTYGHEVQSFIPCNSEMGFWAVLPEREAERLNAMSLDKARRVGKPYQAIFAQVTGSLKSSKREEGFAADYDALLDVSEVHYASKTIPATCKLPQN
ncbi:MAG: hypothetical protein CR993_02540 [Rhodobacterales bacterium]|nr:MAG: hypothetical protein CR993_02540 [Rhodobacterales bacterium]